MLKDRLIQANAVDPFHPVPGTKASSATAYCWMVWLNGRPHGTRFEWIAPCRDRLERDGDYPVYATPLVFGDAVDQSAAALPMFEGSGE